MCVVTSGFTSFSDFLLSKHCSIEIFNFFCSCLIKLKPRRSFYFSVATKHSQRAGCSHLQKRPVLWLLLLHLLQELLDFFSQLGLQLWLDDKTQRGRKCGAQREYMALRNKGEKRGEHAVNMGELAVAGNLQWSTEIWIDIWLNKMQPCAVYRMYACSSFCFALLNSLRISRSAAGFEPYTSGAHVSDQTITYNNWWWTLPILMWSARARRIPERVTKIEERKTLKASHPDLFLLFL